MLAVPATITGVIIGLAASCLSLIVESIIRSKKIMDLRNENDEMLKQLEESVKIIHRMSNVIDELKKEQHMRLGGLNEG